MPLHSACAEGGLFTTQRIGMQFARARSAFMSPAMLLLSFLSPRIMQSGNEIVNNPMDFFVDDSGFPCLSGCRD
jgi:hypothetical protein